MTVLHRLEGSLRTLLLLVAAALLPATGMAQGPTAGEVPAASRSARQMTEAARAFVTSLRPAQRAAVVYAFTGANRSNWSNVPVYVHPRPGLRIRDLTLAQRQAAHALLRASLSSQGYQKVAGVIRLDSIHGDRELAALDLKGPAEDDRPFVLEEAESFGSGSYGIAIFGNPGSDPNWGWIIQGHHLSVSFTVVGDRATFTPLFLGATPLVLEDGIHTGWSALSHEVTRGFELMAALTPAQRAQASEADAVPGDVLYGVGHKDNLPMHSGLRSADMTAAQLKLLRALVAEYVGNADFDVAEAQLEAIAAAGWDQLWFAWRGPADDPNAPLYYRVHGERILIELAQRPNHIHTVVRDPYNDYAERWLDQRLTEEHTANDRFDAAVRAYQNGRDAQ